MKKNQKVLVIVFGIVIFCILTVILLNIFMPKPEIKPDDIEVSERNIQEQEFVSGEKHESKEKEYVNVYFIGKNENNAEVFKAIKREYNSDIDGSKIDFAMYSLISGPKPEEIQKGVYSEIPDTVRILNISEYPDRVVVNLDSTFVIGGGADSLYKRLYQLIKTAKLNSQLPVYLYIDGHKADVIGGEGIMLSQPLSEKSLEN